MPDVLHCLIGVCGVGALMPSVDLSYMQNDCHDLLYKALIVTYYKWNDNAIRTRGGVNIQIFSVFECHPTLCTQYAFAYSNM